jgi:hypothetical protein
VVDNRNFNRLMYQVLERNPTAEDVKAFLGRFRAELEARGLKVLGVTTDGSPLYPQALGELFPGAAHQVCEFHVLRDIMGAVLKALAKVRKGLAGRLPKLPPGRPGSKAARRLARKAERLRGKIRELFENRQLFVKRQLTDAERKTLQRITRGQPELRTLRELVEEVYRLFDRRCGTDTALAKLARLRARVRRFKRLSRTLKKLWSPNLEKALVFLDDNLLPSTSNAVERCNRRHRKMQKTVYRVRTKAHLEARIAMDMLREARTARRIRVLGALHRTRPRKPHRRPRPGHRRRAPSPARLRPARLRRVRKAG